MLRLTVFLATVLCFLPIPALGWAWASDSAPSWMKFHPVTYLLIIGTVIGLGTLQIRFWRSTVTFAYAPLTAMSIILFVRAILLARAGGDPNGTLGVAVTNFLTPVLLLVPEVAMRRNDWRRLGVLLRGLLIINSVIALTESALHTSLFFEQEGRLFRAGGLLGHPLPSALMTGCMIVYLVTASNRRWALIAVLPEIVLHAAALFAFGGRAGLVLVPLVIMISVLVPAPGVSITRRVIQMLGIAVLLAGALLATQLQIDMVQSAMTRFEKDSGSADTRYAALQMIAELPRSDLLWGVDASERINLMLKYDTTIAFENPWITLTLLFGAIFVVPMALALPGALFARVWSLDRSGRIVMLYFFVATAGYVSFGSKSVAILQVMLFVSALCQPREFEAAGERYDDNPAIPSIKQGERRPVI